jgi:F-type H+-transporting ATPase subunit b
MLIDWFTVVAQVINFLILVWLMKRFLYGPILRAIDAREKKIAAELADADAKRAEAKKERDDFAQKNATLDGQRADLINKAKNEAETMKVRLVKEARQAADELTAKRKDSMKTEAAKLNQSLIQRAQQEVFSIARKTLTDLAGASLEERMSATFTERLRNISGTAKSELAEAVKSATQPGIIRSAFSLPEEQRNAIQQAVNETFAADVYLRFETEPEVISGIELTTGGKKLAWSIADYLNSLEIGVDELLHVDRTTKKNSEQKNEATKPASSPA